MKNLTRKIVLLLIFAALRSAQITAGAQVAAQAPSELPTEGIGSLINYIHEAWQTLTRSMTDCRSLADTKLKQQPVLYVPQDSQIPPQVQQLETTCNIRIQKLPKSIAHLGDIKPTEIESQGLLYLPHPYVVPGGIFNEMYGWDSYFIIRGLVESNRLELARGMVENFFFEISHYGGVLNANRAYLLTRSQPPFLTSMILAVYEAEKAKGRDDHEWLEEAYPYALRDYDLWVHAPHLAGTTGLSRYFDFGEGPAPEESPLYYRGVAGYF